MNAPTMFGPRLVATDTESIVSYYPLLGYGMLPINAFLIRSAQPVLVDTGLGALKDPFMGTLRSLIPLEDLRWVWLTHTDADHIGNLAQVLIEAPKLRVITTFLGMGKMLLHQLPVDRVFLLNPGQHLDIGDRRLVAVRPPSFDAPETTGLFDTKTRALFSADCFGALMKEPAESAADIAPSDLRDGLVTWATVDFPWLHLADEDRFGRSLDLIRKLEPSVILSHHLPPATGITEFLLKTLASVRSAPAFLGPDQAAMEALTRNVPRAGRNVDERTKPDDLRSSRQV
jgi:glyoxylase-like metal-dependent hydrolase (beta-lactamase superfamily II)